MLVTPNQSLRHWGKPQEKTAEQERGRDRLQRAGPSLLPRLFRAPASLLHQLGAWKILLASLLNKRFRYNCFRKCILAKSFFHTATRSQQREEWKRLIRWSELFPPMIFHGQWERKKTEVDRNVRPMKRANLPSHTTWNDQHEED